MANINIKIKHGADQVTGVEIEDGKTIKDLKE